jgi:predicted metal-dependent hydrolase
MVFENRRAPFAGGDERVGTLLLWHFVEEIEHRSSVLREEDVAPEFFDLRTGLAGGAMQKFVNYRVRVAIVVPSSRARFDPRRIPSSRDSLSSPS